MLVIILTTIFVLITLWFCPSFNSHIRTSLEHYAPPKAKAPGPAPKKGATPAPKAKGPSNTLTPETVISVPLGILVQFLNKVGAGDIGA